MRSVENQWLGRTPKALISSPRRPPLDTSFASSPTVFNFLGLPGANPAQKKKKRKEVPRGKVLLGKKGDAREIGGRRRGVRVDVESGRTLEGLSVVRVVGLEYVGYAIRSSWTWNSDFDLDVDSGYPWDRVELLFFPRKALLLAVDVVKELADEVRIRPCPIVLASISRGQKACMAEVLEVLEGKGEAQLNREDDIRLVRDCIAGFIFDSCPVDFTSNLAARFVTHPTVLKMLHPLRFASWVANGIASGLDALFLTHFESQQAKYLQILFPTTSMRMPYLILCSEHDDLVPYQTICNFVQRLQYLSADVKLLTWKGPPHVGHYHPYPDDYGAVVTELLGKAAALHSHRVQQVEESKVVFDENCNEIPDPVVSIWKRRVKPGLTWIETVFDQPDPASQFGQALQRERYRICSRQA
ncbi:hypothetical protein MLD38_034893 [Melastoma candidum]|uniref:Uncharacterized protein n=1 Tax=Melastoma candidum TaxID=119954 RepID=A0ACB9MB15_9MYRT|nr:hypothetical protein MLD38_034893 [Melastoma candidum]